MPPEQGAVEALRRIGPAAKDAMPVLFELCKHSELNQKREQQWFRDNPGLALRRIGPGNLPALLNLNRAPCLEK